MKSRKKINLLFIFIFILFSCNLCENYIIKEVPNIHSGVSAVQFKRNCGVTTGNNIQVSIVKTNKALNNKKGNVFIIKGSILDMYWKDTNSLVIKYRCKDEDVFFKRDSLSKYNIIYENTNWFIAFFTLYDIGNAVEKSSTGDHSGWVDVGLDVVSIFVPFVPAGVSKIDDVVDVVNTADNVADSVKAIDNAKDLHRPYIRKSTREAVESMH